MEASALPASAGLARARLGLGAPLLRLRSDEQLVSLFRAGNEDAFRVIHDRYRARMLAYARQMLSLTSSDAEDAVQEVFVRAYAGLRSSGRELALRAWLYRIAHNRCIDELRKPHAIAVEAIEELGDDAPATATDPHARLEQRESLRRLIVDVQRLPEQQRSALLMRELGGMPYADLSGALGVSVPAVKSLLVRARVGLAQAGEARDTACARIREDLIVAHDRGVRTSGLARRHMRDCPHCREFRAEVQGTSRSFSLLLPAIGPLAVAAKLIGLGGLSGIGFGGGSGAAAGSGAGAVAGTTASGVAAGSGAASIAGGSAIAGGGAAAGTGLLAGAGAVAGAGHVATIIAATVVAAGGAIGIQHEVSARPHHHASHRLQAADRGSAAHRSSSGATTVASAATGSGAVTSTSPASAPATTTDPSAGASVEHRRTRNGGAVVLTAPTRSSHTQTSATSTGSATTPTSVSTLPSTTPAGTDPTSTDPTSTDPTSTDPTTTDPTSTDPTSTDPTSTVPTSTDPTSTDPTSTTPVTTTIGASGTPTTPTTFAPTTPSTHAPRIDTRRQASSGAGTILVASRGSGREGARGRERAGRIVRRWGRSDSTTSLGHRR